MPVSLVKVRPYWTGDTKSVTDWLRDIANSIDNAGGAREDDLYAMGYIMRGFTPTGKGKRSTHDNIAEMRNILS